MMRNFKVPLLLLPTLLFLGGCLSRPEDTATESNLLATIVAQSIQLTEAAEGSALDEPDFIQPDADDRESSTAVPVPEASLQSDEPRGSDIIAFITDIYPNPGFTKISSLAFENGIELKVISDLDLFLVSLLNRRIGSAIFAGREISDRSALELRRFIDAGGRVLFFFNQEWSENNDILQSLFQVSINNEDLIGDSDRRVAVDTINYADSMLPTWASGLQVLVTGTNCNAPCLYLRGYISTTIGGGEGSYFSSGQTGNDRLVYLRTPDQSVTFWIRPSQRFSTWFPIDFFDDANIDFLNNDSATLAMLRYLAGH